MTIDQLKTYIAFGLKVFPCRSRPETLANGKVKEEKSPLTWHGFQDATDSVEQVEKWYHQFPGCAWAYATSAEYAILDIDPKNGGHETLAKLIAQHGELPTCPTTETGSKGTHYMMRFPDGTRNSEGRIGKGIDVRADGGYAILPPSRIYDPEGRHVQPYRCQVAPWKCDIPDAPEWLVALEHKDKPKAKTATPKAEGEIAPAECDTPFIVTGAGDLLFHEGSPKGERRRTFLRLVGSELGSAANADELEAVRDMAEEWAMRCTPPFDEWEGHWNG